MHQHLALRGLLLKVRNLANGDPEGQILDILLLQKASWLSSKKKSNTWAAIIVSEYDQEIPQSQTADSPVSSLGRAAQPSRDTRKTK